MGLIFQIPLLTKEFQKFLREKSVLWKYLQIFHVKKRSPIEKRAVKPVVQNPVSSPTYV
jgi:hypothetical protein